MHWRRKLAVGAVLAALGASWALPANDGLIDIAGGSPSLPDDCECVPYYQCANGTIIKNGVGLIDIRIQDGPCSNYLDVCCRPPDRIEQQPTPPRGNGDHTGDDGGQAGGGHDASFGRCGQRNPEGVGFRIVGDTDGEAQFAEFPWMTAVLHEETLGDGAEETLNVYKCGGALIHPAVVLTAAHCVHDTATGLKVRAGEWDTQTKNELLPHQDRAVADVATHPDFRADVLYNDVALLFLDAPFTPAANVAPVCLRQAGPPTAGARCLASGWGKDVFGKEGRYQVILKKVEVPMVAHSECEERLRQTRLGSYFQLHESFVCAGGDPGSDTCKGDGGGPLVCPLADDPTHYEHVGIVAWGIGCGEGNPAVYANVAHARSWIDAQMAARGYDASSYSY